MATPTLRLGLGLALGFGLLSLDLLATPHPGHAHCSGHTHYLGHAHRSGHAHFRVSVSYNDVIDDVIINDGTDRYTLHRDVMFSYLDRRRTLTRRRPRVDFDRYLVSIGGDNGVRSKMS